MVARAGETEAMARSLTSNDGVYFVPALTGLGAPHWEADARGTIVGLTRGTSREHFVRAALEGMAFGTCDVLEAMRGASGAKLDVLRVDGGAAQNNWLMQFQSDVLEVPVERPDIVETTALGAAGLAGIAGGVWKDAESFHKSRTFERFNPARSPNVARQGLGGWRRAVRATVRWARDREGP
jgi:glycerol kinase